MISKKLKNLRETRELTQKDIAEMLNVKPATISRYENGTNEPDAKTLKWYADYFDVSLDWIFSDNDDFLYGYHAVNISGAGIESCALSQRLKKIRLESGMSQNEVSKKLKISQSTWGNYEADIRKPDIEMLARIAQFFDVTTDYLLGLTDHPQSIKKDVTVDGHAVEYSVNRNVPEAVDGLTPEQVAFVREMFERAKKEKD